MKVRLLFGVVIVVLILLVMWMLSQAPPRCENGKVPVIGDGKWFCVEGTEMPTRAGG